ncbi:MAG: RNA polymerase sigma factor [Lacipirellulaceae bacterium]
MPPKGVEVVAVELVARESYGKLVALVARRTCDIELAEDSVSDALASALVEWPRLGVPDSPEAWLLTVARRKLVDVQRRARRQQEGAAVLDALESAATRIELGGPIADERLGLLFACCHPALDPAIRTPLAMQAVLGIDAARIASCFLVSPAAMKQRLTRAKRKVRDAGIRFEAPEAADLAPRVADVLRAIYAGYVAARDADSGAAEASPPHPLEHEAVYLSRTVASLLPDEPEALGLASLLCHCHARRAARIGADGVYVPLDEQDVSRWDESLVDEGERLLRYSAACHRPGRFQVEAAIQSAHAARLLGRDANHDVVVGLYDLLLTLAPTFGARLGRIAAVAAAQGPEVAWRALRSLTPELTASHQPYWALRGDLARRLGDTAEARRALTRAIGLCADPAVRAFLSGRLAEVELALR